MKEDTKLITLGRDPENNFGIVNPPVYHASTVTYPSVEALEKIKSATERTVVYGLHGTPTQFALADALAELEGGRDAWLFPSGLAAITTALLAYLRAGDHLLMVDSVYGPTRMFCDKWLSRFGVETTYYDPQVGEGLSELLKPNTKVVFTESPGSLTFEIQDIPALAAAAHQNGAVVLMDNTWATPLCFSSLLTTGWTCPSRRPPNTLRAIATSCSVRSAPPKKPGPSCAWRRSISGNRARRTTAIWPCGA